MKRILDKVDEKLIAELTRNTRIPHVDLAKKVNLSRNAVHQRVDRLERDGWIKGYTIVAGYGQPKSSTVSAMLFIYRQDRLRGAEVIQALRRYAEIVSCDVMSGEFDLVVRVEASGTERIKLIWREISSLSGVRDMLTAFTLSSTVLK